MSHPTSPDGEAEARAMTHEWQPIETAPKEKFNLALGYFPERSSRRARVKEINTASLHGYGSDGPTHWMPLPDAPKQTA
ncbi:hypothetical protein LCGC14_2871620 [marine sediment metagenome]|uniref:DUF551 domain-containing protein n=1 Tax=marine sediment metagenome TaxID=412755 RepID=A0A0F8Y2L6_9ZZZZ